MGLQRVGWDWTRPHNPGFDLYPITFWIWKKIESIGVSFVRGKHRKQIPLLLLCWQRFASVFSAFVFSVAASSAGFGPLVSVTRSVVPRFQPGGESPGGSWGQSHGAMSLGFVISQPRVCAGLQVMLILLIWGPHPETRWPRPRLPCCGRCSQWGVVGATHSAVPYEQIPRAARSTFPQTLIVTQQGT